MAIDQAIRNVSGTAIWAAIYRARETERALDIASPGLLRLLQREIGSELDRANAPSRFAPAAVESPLREAARRERLPLLLRFAAMLPQSSGAQGSRPWSGICLLERQRP